MHLLAEPDEAGLHEQLHVPVGIGARDVEPRGRSLGAFAQQLLDQPVADVAGIGQPDRIEFHDRPLVAGRLALDAQEPGEAAGVLVDVHEVVRLEGTERQAEQAEHADRRAADRQAERARLGAVRSGTGATARPAPRGRSAGRRGPCPDFVACGPGSSRRLRHRACRARRVGWCRRPDPSPGSSCSDAIAATRRWNRVSPASSGWKAVAMMLRSRTATIRPSSSRARTSTPGPVRSMIGARMKTAWTGVSPRTGDRQLGLERVELAPEGVAFDGHVEERQDRRLAPGDLGRQHDHPGARPEDRRPAVGEVEDGLAQAPALDELAHGRALAARQDEAGDAVEVGRLAHAHAVHADRAERVEVLAERPLQGEDPDLHR